MIRTHDSGEHANTDANKYGSYIFTMGELIAVAVFVSTFR